MKYLLPLTFLLSFCVSAQQRAVVMTFLKAKNNQQQQLETYIRQNWFAMDKIAVERGLFADYRLFTNPDTNQDWDFIVQVSYLDDKGYDGIKREFENIRQNHTTILIEGKSLADLGTVVRSWQTLETIE